MDIKTFAAAAGLVISLLFSSAADVYAGYDALTDDLLRLHILAASDSEHDQQIKLLVRDALISHSQEIFGSCTSRDDILAAARENLGRAEDIANEVLRENNCSYTAHCELADMYFDARTYDDITVPAGKYTALRVIIGSGSGHNWWCVMYPPLCLPGCSDDELSDEEMQLMSVPEQYEAKLYIAELIKGIISDSADS